jgi:lysophospholipase L1-like esterase
MKIEPKSRLVMIGDSITDCGRARPIGERRGEGLGDGYVALVDALLGATHPEKNIRISNTGISGNTVRDLTARWQTDVLDLRPDWLSIMIGTNDVWRQFDNPAYPSTHVYPQEYEAKLTELVKTTRPKVEGLVLMTPFYIQPDAADAMRAMMDRYGTIVKRIAAANNAIFVDTQAEYNRAMQHQDPLGLAADRVHPTMTGHMILALAFLKAVGFSM